MKKKVKKLVVSRETLINLEDSRLDRAVGGLTEPPSCWGNSAECTSSYNLD